MGSACARTIVGREDTVSDDSDAARGNAVLDLLDDATLVELQASLEPVELPRGLELYKVGGVVEHVYFPLSGVISLLHELEQGEVVEVGTVGRDGMAGLSVFLGAARPSETAMAQISGRAMRMPAQELRRHLAELDGPVQAALRRYTQAVFVQLARNAACNRVHTTRQRAARWLLMSADRMGSDTFDLTQEFLAQMLAVRRASVSEVASALAEDGCIRYTRGSITVLDRPRLHANACQCYDMITEATREAMRHD